jgi:2-oxoglutarate dehydrogenase E2 component (dihydrolipoamide succinyltransferase)
MMSTKIVVPALGESIMEATVARWLKKEGEPVDVGEALVELETDKVNLEVGAERAGVLSKIEKQSGEDVKIGDLLGVIEDSGAKGQETRRPEEPAQQAKESTGSATQQQPRPPESVQDQKSSAQVQPRENDRPAAQKQTAEKPSEQQPSQAPRTMKATPSARKLAQEKGISLAEVTATGSGGRITVQDIQAHQQPATTQAQSPAPAQITTFRPTDRSALEERVRMSRRRRTIAQRLVEAQHTAAMLTTYNEVDMSSVMELRKRHKESFKEKYNVGLGIVSFFVKASIGALKAFPPLNSELQNDEIVLKYYYDIGIAVGASEGLVVPVLRNADRLSFAEIEQGIKEFVQKVEEGTLSLEDLRGGTFTITNGGVFGSLMSTPILNPPQVAILGLHKIEERPVARDGEVAIRPMMYVALSYDHRVVDGRESVQFLAKIKELIEDPAALMLEY